MASFRDPLAAVNPLATPQTRPVPGRTDMVQNPAGGYGFQKDPWEQLEDFLILGTTGGSYYLGQDQLTTQNVDVVLSLAKSAGRRVTELATEISSSIPPRAPKPRGCLFALAAVSALGDPDAVQAVKELLPQAVRTTDHLATFFGYRKQLKHKVTSRGLAPVTSRAFRTALASWFLAADVHDVAFRACKARQRKTPAGEAFDLRDALRISHPSGDTPERQMLCKWLAGKASDAEAARLLPAVDNFITAKAVTSPAEAIHVITERRVPWEFLPSEVLKSAKVWEVLTETIGMTALIRNCARMTRLGTLAPFASANRTVVRRLTNPEALAKGRIHPMDAYLALRVYVAGTSQPNPKADRETWTPVAEITDALEQAWELAHGHVEPSGRRLVVAVDSSGSMGGYQQVTFSGASLGTSYEVGCAVALMIKKIEGENAHVIDVDTGVHPSQITRRTNLREIRSWRPSGGGTDLSLPMRYAMQYDLRVDGFALLTDNCTWAGHGHPFQALEQYRRRFNPRARFVDVSMVPYGITVADPETDGVINVSGMDSSLPMVLAGYLRGRDS